MSRHLLQLTSGPSSSTGSLFIDNFDRDAFISYVFGFGIPFGVFLFLSFVILQGISFQINLIPAVFPLSPFIKNHFPSFLTDEKTFEKWIGLITLSIFILLFCPLLFILLWGIFVYVRVNHLLGFSLFLFGILFGLNCGTFYHFRATGWKYHPLYAVAVVGNILILFTYSLWCLFELPFLDYVSLSCVFIGANCLLLFAFVYVGAQRKLKGIREFAQMEITEEDIRSFTNTNNNNEEKKDSLVNPLQSPSPVPVPVKVSASFFSRFISICDQHILLILYVISFLLLLVYSIINLEGNSFVENRVGFITWGVLCVLDLTISLCVLSGQITSPLSTCIALFTCRCVIVLFGDIYFFVGHSVIFIILVCFFGISIVNEKCPKKKQKRDLAMNIQIFINSTQNNNNNKDNRDSSDLKTNTNTALTTSTSNANVIPSSPSSSSSSSSSTNDTLLLLHSSPSPSSSLSNPNLSTITSSYLHSNDQFPFLNSPTVQFILRHANIFCLLLLTVSFLIDLLVSYNANTPDIQLQHPQPQWIAGVLSFFLSIVILFAYWIFRIYSNNEWNVNYYLLLLCFLEWSVCMICGGYLFHFTDSVIILCAFIFGPPIIYTITWAMVEWRKNDYHVVGKTREEEMKNKENNNQKNQNDNKNNSDPTAVSPLTNPDPTSPNLPVATDPLTPTVNVSDIEMGKVTNDSNKTNSEENKTHNSDGKMEIKSQSENPNSLSSDSNPLPPSLSHYPWLLHSPSLPSFLSPYSHSLLRFRILIAYFIYFSLVCGLGLSIGLHSSPSYVGYSITSVLLVIPTTFIPIIEWFNAFEFSAHLVTHITFSLFAFWGFLLLLWRDGFQGDHSAVSVILLGLVFLYPTTIILVFGLLKWRDDHYVMSPIVKISLSISSILLVVLFCILIGLVSPWEIGGTLLVCFILFCFTVGFLPKIRKLNPKYLFGLIVGVLCVLIAYSLAVALQPNEGFIGFSMGWAILFLINVAFLYQSHLSFLSTSDLSYLHSPHVFPVFDYDVTPGKRNPLSVNNQKVYFIFSLFALLLFWGQMAIFFLESTWIGLGVVAVAMNFIVLYLLESSHRGKFLLNSAIIFLEEGSQKYFQTIRKAKMVAYKTQLLGVKAIAVDAERNQSKSGNHNTEATVISIASTSTSSSLSSSSSLDDHPSPSPTVPSDDFGQGAFLGDVSHDLSFNDENFLSDADFALFGLRREDVDNGINQMSEGKLSLVKSQMEKEIPWPHLNPFKKFSPEQVKIPSSSPSSPPTTLSRQQSLFLLLRLHYHLSSHIYLGVKFWSHVTFELLYSIQSMRLENDQLILQMLRDTKGMGMMSVTKEDLNGLPMEGKERKQLEFALKGWVKQQEIIIAERKRKKEEEIAAAAKREEEERLRILEENKRISDENTAHALLDAEKIRKQKEEEMRKFLQIQKDQKDKEIADKKKRDDDEKHRVVVPITTDVKLSEDHRLAELKLLKDQQDEILRKQLEENQKEILRQQQIIQSALSANLCTFSATHSVFTQQHWFECVTCNLVNGGGMCSVCRDVCHKGHQTRESPTSPSPFYCDCGQSNCMAMKSPQQRVLESQKVSSVPSGQSLVDEIIRQCKATGQPYVDKDFTPQQALAKDPSHPKHADWKQFQWRRPEQFSGVNRPQLIKDGADPNDIQQGTIGDCWMLSAMSVLTLRQKDLMDIFITKEHSAMGFYAVNFHKNGQVKTVIIDSLFPCYKDGRPAFAHSGDPNELWVMVLEKAYAKLHRSYESIESGFVDQALVDLSGGVGSREDMSKEETKQQIRNGKLFQQMLLYRQSNYLMGAGSPAGSDSESNASPSGIIQGHAYSILDVQEVDNIQFVRLRNPWGRKEWTGDYSDKSPLWTRRLKVKLNFVDSDDGSFWMNFTDFTLHFEDLYVCRFFDASAGWISLPTINGQWDEKNSGGCTNFDSCKTSPQYLLTISRECTVVINLSQSDTRMTGEKYKAIAIEIYNNKGKRVTRQRCGALVCSNPESYIYRREISLEAKMVPQSEPYTVLISTFNPKEFSQFAINVFSNEKITFQEAE